MSFIFLIPLNEAILLVLILLPTYNKYYRECAGQRHANHL